MKYLFLTLAMFSLVSAMYGAPRYKGDLNADGMVNMTDLGILARSISNGSTGLEYDINSSGKTDYDDLHALASIIISETLTEDKGLNVGIGGWEDDGTDFGGSVGGSRAEIRDGSEHISFFVCNPKKDPVTGRFSVEFGIKEAVGSIYAILFNIRVPGELEFDKDNLLELSDDIVDGHAVFGEPIVKEDGEKIIRFILLSPSMKPFEEGKSVLGSIHYEAREATGRALFTSCQTLSSDKEEADTVEDCYSDIIEWDKDINGIMTIEGNTISIVSDRCRSTITGLSGSTPLSVFNINGKMVLDLTTEEESISVDYPNTGVYIVRIGRHIYKIKI
ncbi:MAG: hypothetical protein K2K37_06375 [Muribaculaceae bacterium]|nr:hypothetical protein [Muribaculaceae bacterium]